MNVEVDEPFSFFAHTVLVDPKSGERLQHIIQRLRDRYVVQFPVNNASTAAAIAWQHESVAERPDVVRLLKSLYFGILHNGKDSHLWAMNCIGLCGAGRSEERRVGK